MRASKQTILPVLLLAACAALTASSAPADGPPAAYPVRNLLHAALLARRADRIGERNPASGAAAILGNGTLRPWRVGIQAGHWMAERLPEELARIRWSMGALWQDLKERDVNIRIARAVAEQLAAAGIRAEILSATVPAGYRADAFVSIHCDIGGSPYARGWKAAAPWRASEASLALRDSIARSYGPRTEIPEDRYGVTAGMRGYYAFASDVYRHAAAPETPCAILEAGFLSSPEDRRIVVEDPQRAARGISDGILSFLAMEAGRASPLQPSYPPMRVASRRAPVRYFPQENGLVAADLPGGTLVHPVGARDGWVEMMVWNDARVFGWMKRSELKPVEGG